MSATAQPERAWSVWRDRILRGLIVAYLASSLGSFIESFHGLIDWFHLNGYTGFYAWIAPAMIDIVTVFSEAVLLIAIIEGWPRRAQLGAWAGTVLSLAVSVAGNIGRAGWPSHWYHHVPTLIAYAVPPLALTGLTALGLVVVKRFFGEHEPGRTHSDAGLPADVLVALSRFRGYAELGTLPSVREVRAELHCGQPRAERIRAYLTELGTVLAAPDPSTEQENDHAPSNSGG